MAFEDRFSPSAATSPNSGDVSQNPPDSPESSRTSPYTCQIIHQKTDSPRMQLHFTTDFNQNQNPSVEKSSIFRISTLLSKPDEPHYTSSPLQSPSVTSDSESVSSDRPKSPNLSLPEPSTSLKYSIHNILQPDFGKSAVQRTKSSKIGFKPYERTETISSTSLGSLCQAVSQIGRKVEAVSSPVAVAADAGKRAVGSLVPEASPAAKEEQKDDKIPTLWPAWVYCTRYSDRPSSGPRSRRMKKPCTKTSTGTPPEEKRPRTAFSGAQLARLKHEFAENRYLTERRRQQLSAELGLNEAQIKIWFQNKRAKIKKASGQKNPLALQLMAQGLYNHSTVACDEDEMAMGTPAPSGSM